MNDERTNYRGDYVALELSRLLCASETAIESTYRIWSGMLS